MRKFGNIGNIYYLIRYNGIIPRNYKYSELKFTHEKHENKKSVFRVNFRINGDIDNSIEISKYKGYAKEELEYDIL